MKPNIFSTSTSTLALTLILFSSLATAQQVNNIDFTQEGKTIKITYDLLGESSQTYEVKIWYTTDGGKNWHGPLQYVSGDVGKNQKPGYGKAMVWDVLKEVGSLESFISFKIEAVSENTHKIINKPEVVFVKGGTFWMGRYKKGAKDEKPEHKVILDDFYIGKYEITNKQYCEFLNSIGCKSTGKFNGVKYIKIKDKHCQIYHRYNKFLPNSGTENKPVVEVNWYAAKAYCEWAGGRLPTEAEWEYASRGGNKSRGYIYSGSDYLNSVAWNYAQLDLTIKMSEIINVHIVGEKSPNELGLFDMTGNALEWCSDWYDDKYYKKSPKKNPIGPFKGRQKVLRGGASMLGTGLTTDFGYRTTNRYNRSPEDCDFNIGFRIVIDVKN